MSFSNLIQIERKEEKVPKAQQLGCSFCTLDSVKGIHKVMGKVRGKKIFVWAQSPGMQENKARKELIGPSGKFLWYELKRVGIKREDCDIQNVVRCVPADRRKEIYPPLVMRAPSKLEIKCCSLYNKQAIEKSKAKIHLVFGAIAGAALLGKELKKEKRVFFSDNLNAWVVYLDHPSYFLRMGYTAGSKNEPNAALLRFREDLKHAKRLIKQNSFDRFHFLKKQKYIGVTNRKLAYHAYHELKKAALRGEILIADMEEGKVDKHGRPDDHGTAVALCCGFTTKPGTTYVFALGAPDSGASQRTRELNRRLVNKLMAHAKLRKGFHFGVSDVGAVKRLLDEDVKNYSYDTLLADYFMEPNAHSYGLAAIAERRYPDFADYKTVEAEAFTHDFKKLMKEKKFAKHSLTMKVNYARSKNGINLARLPWKKMLLYNGGDCHLEKLVELDTKKYVHQPLMQVYIDASFVLQRMERTKECQPIFDYTWHKKLARMFKMKVKSLRRQLFKISGKYSYITNNKGEVIKKKFNPDSPQHVMWFIYKKLKCKFEGESEKDKPNTRAGTLLRIALKYPKAKLIVDYRQTVKAMGTYIKGYKKCADLNEGHLRTNWKMTGTSTGRLSSGKSKDKGNEAVINFQNIHGDPLIKCLLISDKRWYKVYEYWKKFEFDETNWKQFENLYVDLGFDFSQNELRQLAEESGDKNLIEMFSSGADPHVEVGHALTGWPKEKIAHDDRVRKLVKNMQFGLVYGLAGEGLYQFIKAFGVKTTLKEVQKFHAAYFKRFPGVKRLQEKYRKFVEKHGYVKNWFGFRRPINVNEQKAAGQDWDGAFWGNQAINTPIQGAAHQLLMFVIATLFRKPKEYKLLINPNKEIHDSLFFRIKLKYLFKAGKQGMKLMVQEPVNIVKNDFGLEKKVPLATKPKAGFRFGVLVEGIGDKIKTEYDFLNAWCEENKKLEKSFANELKQLTQ